MDTLNDLAVKGYQFFRPYISGGTIVAYLLILIALLLFKRTQKLAFLWFLAGTVITVIVVFGGWEHLFG